MRVYILNLERGLTSGRLWWWKPHQRGYTTKIEDAGIYEAGTAKIENDDIEIAHAVIMRLLGTTDPPPSTEGSD